MHSFRSKFLVLLASPLLAVVLSCDSRPSATSSMTEATVKGTVTINGKKATEGEVVFDPSNYERKDAQPRVAPIREDGSYEITTLVGYNMIRVEGEEAAQADASYTAIDFEVARGENTLDIVLPPPAQ